MMPTLHFITHPEVVIDPSVPVPEWPLSPEGVRRMNLALENPWMSRLGAVFSSAERKATDAARLVADRFGLQPVIVAELGENDRSATGYLPRAEFEATADLFFAHPERSVRGWERAVDAQRRIVAALERVMAEAPGPGDIAVISHGGVGALFLCHLKGVPISRAEDQPGTGGGCVYSFNIATRALITGWHLIED
ncbi:histidine phosphatase family protein [Roseomonas sp. BN140053]|uniref:histidine phosphatase family protein n=1 Tax=Roseomonas sp. BN140053 TaxID=3391898 RepID=UPI0039E82462